MKEICYKDIYEIMIPVTAVLKKVSKYKLNSVLFRINKHIYTDISRGFLSRAKVKSIFLKNWFANQKTWKEEIKFRSNSF